MKALSVLLLFVAAIGFTLSGCADKPGPVEAVSQNTLGGDALGKATVVTQSQKVEMDYYLDPTLFPCLGEGMHMTGTYHFVTQTLYDGLGNYHGTWHYNRQDVFGVSDGGTIYRQTGGTTQRMNVTGEVGGVYHFSETVNFLGHGGGASNDFTISWQVRYVVNANGVEIMDFEEFTAECKK